jgi:HD superfamily phosphohydrolase YqeK
MTELLERARAWVLEVHPHPRHLERTLDWAVELDPQASEAVRIAAITHDIERAFPDREAGWDSATSWDDPAYNRWHQDRCADMIAGWLREQDAEPALIDEVDRLVRNH